MSTTFLIQTTTSSLGISWWLHNIIHSKFITLYLSLYLVFSFAILFTNYSSNHISLVFLIKRIVYITLNGRSPNFHIMTKKEWNRRRKLWRRQIISKFYCVDIFTFEVLLLNKNTRFYTLTKFLDKHKRLKNSFFLCFHEGIKNH